MRRVRPLFHGVYPVLATPFHPDRSVDLEGIERLARFCRANGSDGLVYGGNASEFTTLTVEEREAIVDRIRRAVPELPLVVGVAASAVRDSIRLTEHARVIGAEAVMAMPPFPRASSDEELLAFYRSLEAAGGLPIVLQNSVPPVGLVMRSDLMISIVAAVPAVRCIKEESADSTHKTSRLVASGRDFAVMGGLGSRYGISERARGGVGTMPASSLPEVHVAIWDALDAGDDGRGRAAFAAMLPLIVMSDHLGPSLHKAILVERGVIASTAIREQGYPAWDEIDQREMKAWLTYLEQVVGKAVLD